MMDHYDGGAKNTKRGSHRRTQRTASEDAHQSTKMGRECDGLAPTGLQRFDGGQPGMALPFGMIRV